MSHDFTQPALEFHTLAQLAAKVDAAGPRRWLIRGIWPAGDYGMLSSTPKAHKTWTTCDLAVSVASGTPWLGRFPIDTPGPVLMFVGEGGEANTVRRLRATAEAHGVTPELLPIVVCVRAPRLGDDTHLALMAAQIEQQRPALVTLDPLYLSIGKDAQTASLTEMGALLDRPRIICQELGAALFAAHHSRKGGGKDDGGGTGVGGAEWARVLIGAEHKSSRTDAATGATDTVTKLAIKGGEIPDQAYRVHRRIWSDDPDNLDAALHLTVTVADADDPGDDDDATTDPASSLPPAARKLLEALTDEPRTSREIVDAIAYVHGHGLKRPTVSTNLNKLRDLGLADYVLDNPDAASPFAQKLWHRTTPAASAVSATQADASPADASARVSPPIGADAARRHGNGDTGPADTSSAPHATQPHPRGTWRVSGQPIEGDAA